ncbi:MAG: molybdopterin-dependent oxidoreductase [Planctomycetota bacterium]|nr:molybdopterin-dependent oxidoreductase [Planctomycetota bacterium]MEC8338121.1 molybdopterin-dependent oxidoreductase [Planctomycetota bacterium]
MSSPVLLQIDGEVAGKRAFTWEDLKAIDLQWQIDDVSLVDPSRSGGAVWLRGILEAAEVLPEAKYITLHSDRDDFHASLPLIEVHERGMFIYRNRNQPLPVTAGGPVRFFIRDHTACQATEVDECANVKFVERIEFSRQKGFDNRPLDDAAHEALHRQENH